VRSYLQEHGVLLRAKGDTIMIAPPFVVSEPQIDRIVDTIGEGIREVLGGL